MATESATQILKDTLRQWGMDTTALEMWNGWLDAQPEAEIFYNLRQTPQYKEWFGGLEERRRMGIAMSEAEYNQQIEQYDQILRATGAPQYAYDRKMLGTLIANNVSVNEFAQRITSNLSEVFQAPPVVRQAMNRQNGFNGDEDLIAFAINPARTQAEVEQRVAAAIISGRGSEYGLNISDADAIAAAQEGELNATQARQGLEQVAATRGLYDENVDETEDLTAGTGIAAVAGKGQAASKVKQRVEERTARFAGGGGAVIGSKGVVGLGTANE